jgi:hypothetical protein
MKESAVSNHVRLYAAQLGIDLWRNNSGGFYDDKGRFVRYGLGNFTEKDGVKSSDFIGITPLIITAEMVGCTAGIFTAVEMKETGWHLTKGDKRGLAQKKFIDIVKKAGGYAGFATDTQDLIRILRNETR